MQPAAARRAHGQARLEPQRGGRRCSPTSSSADVRTICFARSRRAAELIYQFAQRRLDDPRPRRQIAPYRAGYTPAAATGDRAAARGGRAAGRGRDERARAGHRHRPSRRRDLGHVPRHRREPAPAVGPRRAAPAAASRCTWPATMRSTSSSAAIPRSSSSGRSRRRSSTTPPSSIYMSHLLAAAYEGPLEPADAETLGDELEAFADRLVAAGRAAQARRPLAAARARAFPAARGVAALGLAGQLHDRRRQARRAARLRRGRARVLDRPSGRGLPPPRRAVRGRGARHRRAPGARAAAPTATTTRSRRSRPRPSSRRSATAARRSASSCASASCR